DLQQEDPKAYKRLFRHYDSLASKDSMGQIIQWTAIGGGVVLLGLGVSKTSSADSSGTSLMLAGTGLSAAGIVAGLLIRPGRKDLLRFINHHNKVRKSSPLKLNLGINIIPLIAP